MTGAGFILKLPPAGKWWRYKYRFACREKRISLGTYPDITLKEARLKHAEARKQLANGIDPSSEMKKVAVATAAGQYSFQSVLVTI